jgi:thiamine-monophosphate kinase
VATPETVGTLGEIEALKRTVSRLNLGEHAIVGSGDDAAVVATTEDRFVVSTDTMIEDHDFRLDWSNFYDLGFKAIATNVSDVAAMGATPTALVVAIAVPASTLISDLEAFADGLRAACELLAPGAAVVGGDLAASDKVFISVTAHGALNGLEPVLRSGAKVGDIVAVAGTLGRAAAGLALLASGNSDAVSAYDDFVAVQLRPEPPVASGANAASAGATSMLDVSDGLAKDAARIARASEVSIHINRRDLDGFVAMVEEPARAIDANALDWVLYGGEDHSLLATFVPGSKIPREFKPIGLVVEAVAGKYEVSLDGSPIEAKGWDSILG